MLTLIYGRVSTDKQDISIEAQEARVLRYCDFNEWTCLPEHRFYDDDVSGTIPLAERPAGRKVMTLIRAGGVKRLVVAKLDRLGRDTIDLLLIDRELRQLGVDLHIADMDGCSINTNTAAGKFIFTQFCALAEMEVGMIRERTRHAMDRKRELGQITGSIPFGKRVVDGNGNPITLGKGERWPKDARLEDDPEEQQWIRYAAELQRQGWSMNRIAVSLNDRGLTAKGGGIWRASNVEKMLGNKHTKQLLATPGT